ncbi:NADH:flavin oxidoreductase/NADH oxidase [Limosilactobacillus sp.]|uniref:oxidoreductase n=1 Tax=Limosilactobacillus sp. TaxID=2773925 RepID=UPI0035A078FE
MSKLLSSATVGGLTLKNRVVMSPMCLFDVQQHDGMLTPVHFAHYVQRAMGQVGLIIIESTAVDPDGGITNRDLGLWNDQQGQELAKLVRVLHSLGAKVGIQLNHAGRKAQNAEHLMSAGAVAFDDEIGTPAPMTTEQIHHLVDEFGAAAKRAQDAGFDMIDVHAAHGYLLDQFLSPLVNQRDDEYGGSLANRYRLLHEVVSVVKEHFNGTIWTRLSLTDYLLADQQNSLTDWQQVGKWLAADGVSLLDISTGGLLPIKPDFPIHDGYQTRFATAMKQAVDIPVSTVGLLDNPGLAEYILQNDQADLIMEGRALLRNPNWVAKAAKELHEHDLERFSYNHSYYRGLKYL